MLAEDMSGEMGGVVVVQPREMKALGEFIGTRVSADGVWRRRCVKSKDKREEGKITERWA